MRRPSNLAVDTSPMSSVTTSTISFSPTDKIDSPFSSTSGLKPAQIPVYQPALPTFSLLFSSLSRRDLLCLFLPAMIASLISGGIAPFMTVAVGGAFDAFAKFPLFDPSQADKDKLLHGVGIAAVELLALAVAALIMSSITSSLWISTGERNALALRRRAYQAVTKKDMIWFDRKMGFDGSVQSVEGDGPVGAGGMMAQFSRYILRSMCFLSSL
jgi:ATP-binding cassette subfamily B (MDR/TAP) protein 1